jgi:hypothetical protein
VKSPGRPGKAARSRASVRAAAPASNPPLCQRATEHQPRPWDSSTIDARVKKLLTLVPTFTKRATYRWCDMLISLISVLISSVALLGVAMGLLLQARQLRASRIQAARASQVELLRFAIENPSMVKTIDGFTNDETFVKFVIRNWYFTYLSMSYDNRTISKASLQMVARTAFKDAFMRKFWSEAKYSYSGVATSRREKDFFTIIDAEFQQATRETDTSNAQQSPPLS